jgi:hypothetical protein
MGTYKGINYPDKTTNMVTSNISSSKIESTYNEYQLTRANVPVHVADEAELESLEYDDSYSGGIIIGPYVENGTAAWREDIGSEQRFNGGWSSVNTGLMTLRPTSVVFSGSGSGSVNETGLISFTGVTGIFINGIFGPAFKNYKAIIRVQTASAATSNMTFQFCSEGVNNSSSSYVANDVYTAGTTYNGIAATRTGGNLSYGPVGTSAFIDAIFYNPYLGKPSWSTTAVHFATSGAPALLDSSGYYNSSSVVFDGIRIFPLNVVNITGTMQFYGFN